MPLIESNFETSDALNADFAGQISNILSTAIALNGTASLAVSGGRTPLALFKTLSETDIEWSKVVITLADERWVDADHSDSNERLVRENLLVGKAAAARFFPLKTAHENAFDAVESLENSTDQPQMPFDVLILGMGEDAHTASLFPCCDQIEDGLNLHSGKRFIATEPKTAPHQRMSYTLPALIESKHLFLHLTGDKKRAVLHDALRSANAYEKPIKAVVDKAVVTLMWAP